MSIPARIDKEILTAMKSREADRLGLLRTLKSALKNAAIEKGGSSAGLSDAEALVVIRKQAKQREDSIAQFRSGGREDLAAKEQYELELLTAYLPEPLSEAEVDAMVDAAIEQTGANSKAQMGAVMKLLQEKAAGRADGKMLSTAVQKRLV